MGNSLAVESVPLESATFDSVPYFSLEGNSYTGKVVDVYDGDTLTVLTNIDNRLVKLRCRIAGVDTPEMKPPKDAADRNKIKETARQARDYVISRTTNVALPTGKKCKRSELQTLLGTNTLILIFKFLGADTGFSRYIQWGGWG